MSYTSMLINTCTVQRFTEGVIASNGWPTLTWADTVRACRWSTPSNREVKVGAELVLADLVLFLGDVDVTEQDRVVLDSTTYEILSVKNRQNGTAEHHKECMIRTVK